MKEMIAATNNPSKLAEFRRILEPLGIRVLPLREAGADVPPPEETADTFEGNAAIKARAAWARMKPRRAVFADDSGLCVDALCGRPGIYSARYGGGVPAGEKNRLLLKEMKEVPDDRRGAKFVCSVYCILPDGSERAFHGEILGSIAREPRGANGFGFDPIFLTGSGESFAELPDAEKDRVGHRGHALRQMARAISADGREAE